MRSAITCWFVCLKRLLFTLDWCRRREAVSDDTSSMNVVDMSTSFCRHGIAVTQEITGTTQCQAISQTFYGKCVETFVYLVGSAKLQQAFKYVSGTYTVYNYFKTFYHFDTRGTRSDGCIGSIEVHWFLGFLLTALPFFFRLQDV